MAQSKYVGRCVLTVNHLIVLASSGPLVILFAGDTAGRIYCWDVTALLLNYVMDRYNFKCNDPDIIKSTVAEGKAFLQSNEHSVCQDGGVSLMFDMASEKTTSCCAGNNLMANDSMKGNIFQSSWTQHTFVSHDTACKESNAEINQKTKDENEDGVQCGGHVLLNETFEASKRGSLKDSNDEMSITLFEKQSGHSCLPLVGFFLGLPIHVFQAHQSGINALSLIKTKGKAGQSNLRQNDGLDPQSDRVIVYYEPGHLERFSNECRKTKTKVITLANQKGRRQSSKPIKTRSNYT